MSNSARTETLAAAAEAPALRALSTLPDAYTAGVYAIRRGPDGRADVVHFGPPLTSPRRMRRVARFALAEIRK